MFMGLGENSDEDIHRLLRKTSKSLCLSEEECLGAGTRLSVMSFLGVSSSFIHKNRPTDVFQRLLDGLKRKEPSDGWSLIILDPISRFAGASAETDNASATELIALLERLTLELRGRPTVLFGHHMNKTGVGNHSTDQGASRGSSALTDGVRLQINLDRGERRENEPETVTLQSCEVKFHLDSSSYDVDKRLCGLSAKEAGKKDAREKLRKHASWVAWSRLFRIFSRKRY